MAKKRLIKEPIYQEYELYCPVCDHTFKQLVVLHKVPEDFDVGPYLAGMVERHDHKAYQEYRDKQLKEAEEHRNTQT
jgi:C4-type Zn-finger protein